MKSEDCRSSNEILSSLPCFAPDPLLRERILAAHDHHRKRRRMLRLGGIGSLAASLVAAAILISHDWRAEPAAFPATVGEAPSSESRALERQWLASARSAVSPGQTVQMRAIDTELQAAYDRGADADELSTLWARRNIALRELIKAAREGMTTAGDVQVTRI